MKKITKYMLIGLCLMVTAAFLCGTVFSEQAVTITGTVNGLNQIMDNNGQIYEIGDNDKGEELAEHMDVKVRITGTIEEDGELKVITVTSFQVIEE